MPKFLQTTCEVCHEPIADLSRLPDEIREQVYRPGKDEIEPVTIYKTPDGKEPADPGFTLEEPIQIEMD
jgi:hypothetical protein